MKEKAPRWLATIAALACMAALSAAAYAEIPAADPPDIDGVEHEWVVEKMAYAPYTELTKAERSALSAGKRALTRPPLGLIRSADHGYADAQAQILLARSLAKAEPTIVGHELLLWNKGKAARVYVSKDGVVKLLEVGDLRPMLVLQTTRVADSGDREAVEMAEQAFNVAVGFNPDQAPPERALVKAHAIGFADQDGTHTIVRVDPAGDVSFPDW